MTGRKGAKRTEARGRVHAAERNRGALPERLDILVELYGLEAVANSLAAVCDGHAALSRGLLREGSLRRFASVLRELATDAREELDEGLAAAGGRVIGRKTRLAPGAEHAVRGGGAVAYAVVTAVRKSGIRRVHGAPRLTTNRAVRAAGGLTRYVLVEVETYAADGTRLGKDDLPVTALVRFGDLR